MNVERGHAFIVHDERNPSKCVQVEQSGKGLTLRGLLRWVCDRFCCPVGVDEGDLAHGNGLLPCGISAARP